MASRVLPDGRVQTGDWCAEIMTDDAGREIGRYESIGGSSYKLFDNEFGARGFAAAHNGRFGFMRYRGAEKRLGAAHFFSLIEDYRWRE